MTRFRSRLQRLLRWIIPAGAFALSALAWAAFVWVASTNAPPPELIGVEDASWTEAQAVRSRCGSSGHFFVAEPDQLWSFCPSAEGEVELVRYAFREGLIERRWPLPATMPARPGELEIKAVTSVSPDGDLVFVVDRRRPDRERRVALMIAKTAGGMDEVVELDVPTAASVRGLAGSEGKIEIVLEDCRLWVVNPSERSINDSKLANCPRQEGREDVSVEWARRDPAGWSFLWSEERLAATPKDTGERQVTLVDAAPGALPTPVGVIVTQLEWPHSEWMDFSAGNVVNARHYASLRLVDGKLAPIVQPSAGLSDHRWKREPGPSAFFLAQGRLQPLDVWTDADSSKRTAIRVGSAWLFFEHDETEQVFYAAADDGAGWTTLARRWWPGQLMIAPASDGGYWITDPLGYHVAVQIDLSRLDGPDMLHRALRIVEGNRLQMIPSDEGADAAEISMLVRRYALLVELFLTPALIIIFLVVRLVVGRRRGGRWLSGPMYALQLGCGVAFAVGLALSPAYLSVIALL